jgi:branched-chain amino acid transport system permease protein
MVQTAMRVVLALCVVVLAVLPLFASVYYAQLVTKIMIFAIFALSLDLLVGYAGLVSLGHAAFFGLGAYALALLSPQDAAANLLTTLPIALGVSALAALLIGLLVLRTSGVYFIMVTLAFAQMLYYLFHDTNLGGGSDGIYINLKPELAFGGLARVSLESKLAFYYFTLLLLLAVYTLLWKILRSPFGRALQGIKANESRMRSLGFNTFRYKLAGFLLAGVLAGLAGYLSAMQFGFVSPELLSWHQSGNVLMMVILGGIGSLAGPVFGAFAFVALQELFESLTRHWQLLMGGSIVLVVLALPTGLYGLLETLLNLGARPAAVHDDE